MNVKPSSFCCYFRSCSLTVKTLCSTNLLVNLNIWSPLSVILHSWKKLRFLTNLQWMAHMLLKFIAPEMSQNLVPTFQSLDQLNASTGGIADVSYLPRANKFSSKNTIHLRDTYSSLSSMSLKSLMPMLSHWNQIKIKLLVLTNKIRIADTSFCTACTSAGKTVRVVTTAVIPLVH